MSRASQKAEIRLSFGQAVIKIRWPRRHWRHAYGINTWCWHGSSAPQAVNASLPPHSFVCSRRNATRTPPLPQHGSTVVVRARYPVQLRSCGRAPRGLLGLEVLPHPLLCVPTSNWRSVPRRGSRTACPALAPAARTSLCRGKLVSLALSRLRLSRTVRAQRLVRWNGLGRQSVAGPVREKFHREKQGNRRPSRDQYRLPRKGRRGGDVGRKGHADAEQERDPHHCARPTPNLMGGLEQPNCRQEQQAVDRQGPQRRARRICSSLKGKGPLVNVGRVRSYGSDHEAAAAPKPRLRVSPARSALARLWNGLGVSANCPTGAPFFLIFMVSMKQGPSFRYSSASVLS